MHAPFIHTKSKLYLVAPSFGCTTHPYEERLRKAIVKLNQLGHSLVIGKNCFLNLGKCASNTPRLRAKEFMEAYESSSDVILSVGGGEMMYEILDFIDFKKIKSLPPKWFVGFSDNTHLTFTLTTLCDIETIYGVCAGHFHFDNFQLDVLDTYEMLYGRKTFQGYEKYESIHNNMDAFADYNLDQIKNIVPYKYEKPFGGTLIGGNLDCLQLLCGTPYDKVYEYTKKHSEGIVFYFEACDLNVVGIKRALLQLKRSNWFNNIKGFLIGRPLCMNQKFAKVNHINAVIDVLKEYHVPILLDIDLGHLAPSMPFKNGAYATIEYKQNNIFITYQ